MRKLWQTRTPHLSPSVLISLILTPCPFFISCLPSSHPPRCLAHVPGAVWVGGILWPPGYLLGPHIECVLNWPQSLPKPRLGPAHISPLHQAAHSLSAGLLPSATCPPLLSHDRCLGPVLSSPAQVPAPACSLGSQPLVSPTPVLHMAAGGRL